MCIYIYIYIHICRVCYTYIYNMFVRERDSDRDEEREREIHRERERCGVFLEQGRRRVRPFRVRAPRRGVVVACAVLLYSMNLYVTTVYDYSITLSHHATILYHAAALHV